MFKNTFENFIALRYLRSKRKEVFISIITIISLIGVALSVMVLNIVLSVMTGFEEELQSKLIDANAHITIKKNAGSIEHVPELIDILSKVPGITSAYPYTYSQAMIKLDRVAGIPVNTAGLKFDSGARGILIRGLDNSSSPRQKLLKSVASESVLDQLFSKAPLEIEKSDGSKQTVNLPTILLGKELQRKLGVFEGDTVVVLSPELSSSPLGIVPKHRRFLISGFYSSGLVEYESGLAYMGIKEAQEFFGFGSQVTGVEIEVFDRNQTSQIMKHVALME